MNAIVSGRSARALILDGESLKSFDLDDPLKIVSRRRSDLPYLFGEAADLRILENTTIESVERELRMDCHFTWALDLTLISLDSELEDDIRKEALEGLEELFRESATVIRVENVLYSEPLPEDADLTSAIELCGNDALNTVRGFLLRLEASQGSIQKFNQAWESIPTKIFGNHEDRKIFKHTAVKEGLFRQLVILTPLDSVSTILLKAGLKESVQQLLNHSQVLQAWTAPLDEVNQNPKNVTAKTGRGEALKAAEGQFDAPAIEALMMEYYRPLRLAAGRILRRTMSSEPADTEAEEIVQEVFLAIFRKGFKDDEESIGTYLMRTVHDKALSRVRRIRRHRVDVEQDETLEGVRDLEAEFEKKESSKWLEHQMSGMSPEDQLILHLFIDGLSREQIAQVLDISESAARLRLSHAKERLIRRARQSIHKSDSRKKIPATSARRAERRGWGLKLIRTLMDEVEFERVDDGTSLRMTKYLQPQKSTQSTNEDN